MNYDTKGEKLEVGDNIILAKGSGKSIKLHRGKIIGFTPMKIRIECDIVSYKVDWIANMGILFNKPFGHTSKKYTTLVSSNNRIYKL